LSTGNCSPTSSGISPTPELILCLSGGGFRATFYHLGVVKLLRDYGLLQRVTQVLSVSGGSIMAAHLALNWDEYSRPGDEASFYRVARELILFGRLDVRGRIVRRSLLLGWFLPKFRRTRQLEAHYARLLRNASVNSTALAKPRFSFLATSMTTGKQCRFTAEGFADGDRLHMAPGLPLAVAVAASSAFPPLFPAVELTRDRLHAKTEEFPMNADYLTDGGVFDNLGRSAVFQPGSPPPSGHVLISDASASFDWKLDWSFRGIVSRTVRTTDILMQRVASLEEQRRCGSGAREVVIPIGETVRASDLKVAEGFVPQDLDLQILASQIRTDLNEFSLEEIAVLIRHGYEVALKRLTTDALLGSSFEPGQPSDPCVAPALPGGWDWAPAHIEEIGVRRMTFRAGKIALKNWHVLVETERKLAALGGRSLPPPEESILARDYARRLIAVKKSLERSRLRDWGLWNWSDWVCWLNLVIFFAVLTIAFWWYWSAHS